MVLVLENGIEIGIHPDAVAEHILLVVEKAISAEIVSKISSLVHYTVGGGAAHCYKFLPSDA